MRITSNLSELREFAYGKRYEYARRMSNGQRYFAVLADHARN